MDPGRACAPPPLLLACRPRAIRASRRSQQSTTLRSWGRSRRDLFEELDRPALTPLPDEPYRYAEWKRCGSISTIMSRSPNITTFPHNLVHQEVEARITARTVEIFLRGKRIASHLRSTLPHRPTTFPSICRARIAAIVTGPLAYSFRSRQGRPRRRHSDRRHPAVAAAPGTGASAPPSAFSGWSSATARNASTPPAPCPPDQRPFVQIGRRHPQERH